MNVYDFLNAMDSVDDAMKLEVLNKMYDNHTPRRRMRKLSRTLMIAAAIAVILCTTAFAAGTLINSDDKAWDVAQKEIQLMKELGILSEEVNMSAQPERIYPLEDETTDDYWFERLLSHRYVVGSSTSEYFINMDVDTTTGKITRLHIEAYADENDMPVGTTEVSGETYNLYENYDDIFPDITVDEFCTRLAAYWGFSEYSLAETQDDFYGYQLEAPSGDLNMMDVPEEIYLTIFFEGDQEGVPMYIEKNKFPGRVSLMIGTNHTVG